MEKREQLRKQKCPQLNGFEAEKTKQQKTSEFISIKKATEKENFNMSAVAPDIKDLLDNVHGMAKGLEGSTRGERKKVRQEKMDEFKEKTETILGPSFDENKWKLNNKDDEKKDVTKIYDRVLCKELNLAVADE